MAVHERIRGKDRISRVTGRLLRCRITDTSHTRANDMDVKIALFFSSRSTIGGSDNPSNYMLL